MAERETKYVISELTMDIVQKYFVEDPNVVVERETPTIFSVTKDSGVEKFEVIVRQIY